ncbi:MAG: replication-relaxation family protein [Sedimentisphaerales bacterium]|nr:replication-relaxation family protein [Sedimentisphaerales bacterium]
MFMMSSNDIDILTAIADFRNMTPSQITVFFQKNKQVIWRRLRALEKEGLIQAIKREFGRGRGRPENSLGLTECGLKVLKEKEILDEKITYEKVGSVSIDNADHQSLLNWFRIHLEQIEKVFPRMKINVMTYNSPFLPKCPNDRIFITNFLPCDENERGTKFTPDAVICTNDSVASKSCLFFLEVDCGTETIASPKRDMTDIRQKISNYGMYFDCMGYKRYEDVFKHNLNGFRLLFLTHTPGRLAALCKLTQEIPSTDFVWLTDFNSMIEKSISDKIWIKGGHLQCPRHSIIGSLSNMIKVN